MNDICCEKKMEITFPPWGTLVGFFHARFYSECKICGKKYLYTWNSGGWITGNPGYNRRELSEEDIKRRIR